MTQVHLLQSQKEELEKAKLKPEAEVVSMKTKPSYPDINQLTELLVNSLKPELSKLLASHDFASCLPTKLKELPSKITGLSEEIKDLKQHIKDMEIELPGDLTEIPTKSDQISSVQEKLKTLDSLPSLLHKGEKNTKDDGRNLKDELIDLLGKDVVTQEDGSDEVISNLKVSDLHSAEWREVLQACPDKMVQKLKKDSWLELQFSLADSFKLNVVYLLRRS
ncbi:hypothetical protein Tco_0117584 [Tanacetum coccineum]